MYALSRHCQDAGDICYDAEYKAEILPPLYWCKSRIIQLTAVELFWIYITNENKLYAKEQEAVKVGDKV